jgi:hypothetical protein
MSHETEAVIQFKHLLYLYSGRLCEEGYRPVFLFYMSLSRSSTFKDFFFQFSFCSAAAGSMQTLRMK